MENKMKRIFLTLMALCALAGGMLAQGPQRVPAAPYPIVKQQPNGETVTILLRGDEHKHWMMTEDGWQVVQDDTDRICYALKKKDGTIVASKKLAHDADKRSKCEQRWLKRKGINKLKVEN